MLRFEASFSILFVPSSGVDIVKVSCAFAPVRWWPRPTFTQLDRGEFWAGKPFRILPSCPNKFWSSVGTQVGPDPKFFPRLQE